MTNLMLAALAAALVAAFESFPIAFAAAMTIGLAQTLLGRYQIELGDWLHFSLQGFDKSVPFIVIVVVLIMRGQAIPLRDFPLQRLPVVGSGRVRPPSSSSASVRRRSSSCSARRHGSTRSSSASPGRPSSCRSSW